MVHLKQQECDRLQEHIRQSDAKYDNVVSSAEAMEREKQEVSELLVSLRTQVLEIQQKHEEFRVEERQRLKLESDRVMEEACLAFNSAESDRVKILKLKLKKEKARRKKGDERNEKLLKEDFSFTKKALYQSYIQVSVVLTSFIAVSLKMRRYQGRLDRLRRGRTLTFQDGKLQSMETLTQGRRVELRR
ncbi:unnamed protein product [Porites evermanni]|uniref:Uncharacterized protein n=1 Tax=Porites evermanni TaxID=104178 RepID=A0ABN8SGR3_9CNID|nr:unnamed protein product [Porites evermanni]